MSMILDSEVVDLGAASRRLSSLPDLPEAQILSVEHYAGGQRRSFADVQAVVPPPATATWRPMPHEAVLAATLQALDVAGLQVTGTEYALRDGKIVGTDYNVPGAKMIALWGIGKPDSETGLMVQRQIGIINALDKSQALRVSVGETVFICANLCLNGALNLNLKHTKDLGNSLFLGMRDMVSKLPAAFQLADQRRAVYDRVSVGVPTFDHMAMTMERLGILPQSKLGTMYKEFEQPSAGHKPRHTLLGVREAFTATLKGYDNPFQSADRMELATGLFDAVYASLN